MNTISAVGGERRMSPAQRMEAARKLNLRAVNEIRRLGYVPEPDEIRQLADDLVTHGLIDLAVAAQARAILSEAIHDEGRVTALLTLVDGSREAVALAAVKTARGLFDDRRVEFSTLPPGGGGRRSEGGVLPHHERACREFVERAHGREGIYIGRDPRRPDLDADAQGKATDVSSSTYVGLDFDLPDAWPDDWTAWQLRCREIAETLKALGPVSVNLTGGGVHAWFRVTPSTDPTVMQRRAALFRAVASAIGADPKPCDPQSILRVWPSLNMPSASKRARGQRIALVHAVHEDWTAPAHDPDALADRLLAAFSAGPLGRVKTQKLAGNGEFTADLNRPDRWLKHLEATGRILGPGSNGRVNIRCPFEGDHSSETSPSATSYLGGGRFKCLHMHCDQRDNAAFQAEIVRLHEEEDPAGARAVELEALAKSPLDDAEVEARATVARAEAARGRTGRCVADLQAAGAIFFTTPDSVPHVRLAGRCWSLDASSGQSAVVGFFVRRGNVLSRNAVAELLAHLKALATVGPVRGLDRRFAASGLDGSTALVFHDLADEGNRIVAISSAGWDIRAADDVGPWFGRANVARGLPEPVRDGKPDDVLTRLLRHVNAPPVVKAGDPNDRGVQARAGLLLVLAGWLMPAGGAPLLMLSGPEGSGKTSAARRLKSLLDPAAGATLRLSERIDDLFVSARAHAVLIVDNVSRLTDNASDALAQIATGAGVGRRRLYSDGDLSVIEARSGVILTGIPSDLAERGDLRDRAVSIELEPLPVRRTEAELDASWAAELPALLASLYDAVARALALLPAVRANVKPDLLPRLADAAIAAEAMAQGIGWRADLLLEAVGAVRQQHARDHLGTDPLIRGLDRLLAAHKGSWAGSATALRAAIDAAGGVGLGPHKPEGVGKALARLRAQARLAFGWNLRETRSRKGRTWVIEGKPGLIEQVPGPLD